MAIIPRSEIILGGRIQIPEGIYGVEIVAAEVKIGQKEGARPTLRVDAIIIEPSSVVVGGHTHQVIGRKFQFMPCLIDSSVDYGLGAIIQGLQTSNFNFDKFGADGEVDTEKFHVLSGHRMQMHLSSYEDVKSRPATDDELRANPTQRRVPLKDLHGNTISGGWFVCSPKKSKGEFVSPGWADVIGGLDDGGLL